MIKGKTELKPIVIDGLFGGQSMKVHKYQLEVMWLVLAVLGFWVAADHMGEFVHKPIRQDGLQKKPLSPIHIRPPPLFA